MPLLGTRGALSARGMGMLNLGGGYWIATLRGATGTATDQSYGIGIDGFQNSYIAGTTYSAGAGNGDMLIAKYNTSAAIQWQRTLGLSDFEEGEGIAVDTSGNIYVVGRTVNPSTSDFSAFIAKYNTSGVIQWQRTLTGPSFDSFVGVAVDASSNVYVGGTSTFTPLYLLAKYDSNGALQWQRTLSGAGSKAINEVAIDSSGNVYFTGHLSLNFVTIKYNSSGVLQWQRVLSGAGNEFGHSIALDASNNVYIVGSTSSYGTGGEATIVKYNSSGTLQWQKTLGGATFDAAYSVAVNSNSDVYIAGITNSNVLIAKYNTSGTLLWQRTLVFSSGTSSAFGISLDYASNMYISGTATNSGTSNTDVLILKLPGDGSKTGTYGAYTYTASSLTDATASFTDAAGTLTDTAGTLTDSAASLTDTASSLISTVIPV